MNVYLPYQCDGNHTDYLDYLGKIIAILNAVPTSNVAVVGDFCTDVNTNFESDLVLTCDQASLIVSDYIHLGRTSGCCTYVSEVHSTTSLLDHYICNHDMHATITSMSVFDKLPSSDHLSLGACFALSVAFDSDDEKPVLNQQSAPVYKCSNASTVAIGANMPSTLHVRWLKYSFPTS